MLATENETDAKIATKNLLVVQFQKPSETLPVKDMMFLMNLNKIVSLRLTLENFQSM